MAGTWTTAGSVGRSWCCTQQHVSQMRWPRALRRNTSLMTSRSGSSGIGLFALYHQLHALDAIQPKVSQRIAKMAVSHQEDAATPL